MYTFSKLLQFVKYQLKRCNQQCFGNIFHAKVATQTELDDITREIREVGLSETFLNEEARAVMNLEECVLQEEIYWK